MLSDKQRDFLASEEAAAVFKAAWHKHQRKGLEGSKVEAGLAAVVDVLDEID